MIETKPEINIKELTQIEPKKKIPFFDPSKQIRRVEWRIIEEEVKKSVLFLNKHVRYSEPVWRHLQFLSNAVLIAPHKITPSIDDATWNRLKSRITNKNKKVLDEKLQTAKIMRFSNPQRFATETKMQETLWRGMQAFIDDNSLLTADVVSDVLLIDPTKSADFVLSDETWNETKNELDEIAAIEFWIDINASYAELKIIDPQRAAGLVSDETFRRAIIDQWKWIEDLKEGIASDPVGNTESVSIRNLITAAKNLTILTAEEIRITDQGVKFLLPTTELATKKPDVPIMRRF